MSMFVHKMEALFFEAAAALLHYRRERHDDDLAGLPQFTEASVEAQTRLMGVIAEYADQNADMALMLHERMLTEAIQRGELPREIRRGSLWMHAKAFLSALANLGKMLGKVEPEELAAKATAAWDLALPELAEVRNSTQHPEDRARGMGRAKRGQDQPLQLKPVDNQLFKGPGKVLALDNLRNDHFGTTVADGQYLEVEVSEETLGRARDVLEMVMALLQWEPPDPFSDPGEGMTPEVVDWSAIRQQVLLEEMAQREAAAKTGED